mgnify:CR=1 FL=1|tara:strand:- start:1139 stop:3559 length:2421 start_codon:yes stop_codon:yes gene_type:complete
MDKKSPLVQFSEFPNHLATDAVRATEEYGLKVGQAMQYEWFNRDGSSCKYYDRQASFHERRLYGRGDQSIAKYKAQMAINGDLSNLNLNWEPPAIINKFRDIIVNGMSERLFSPKAYAQDITSAEKRSSYQEVIEKDMMAKQFLMQTKQELGIDAFNIEPDKLPGDDQELQLHMQLEYKPGIEIAAETAISTVMDMNDFYDIKRRYLEDVVTIGWGIIKHRYSYNEGIKLEYVDPANVIHSYTEDPHFQDVFYWGEVKQVALIELKKINPNLTPADIEEIKKLSGVWGDEYALSRPTNNPLYNQSVVNLLYFNYKTDKNFIYKKKILDNGGERVIRRDESFNPEEDNELFEKVEKRIDVWYDGVMVLGTNKMLKWELMRNMVRPDAAFQRAIPNYISVAPEMYKGSIKSTTGRMEKYADLICLTDLKMQQVQQKMTPPGVFIDVDGVNEVDLGNGGTYNAQKALDLYFATGSVVGRSYTGEGEYNNAKVPITELNSNGGQSQLVTLTGQYNHWLNMIRDVTGINEAADASNPDPNSLVGLQKLAALNSNTATKHIFDAVLFMTQKAAEAISLRVSDVLEYAEDKEEFANQIGKFNVSVLDDISNLYLSSFGIFIEVAPDEEQKSMLEQNIQVALSRDSIDLEDAIDIREVKNLKMANQLLKLKRRKKEERVQQNKMAEMQSQQEANMQSQQAAAQAKMQEVQTNAEAKIALANAEAEGKIRVMEFEVQSKYGLMEKEFQYNMQLKGITDANLEKRDEKKEEAKDKRVDKQSTQQSTLIQQRKDNTPPVNFESSEDTMDGIGLESFG